VAQLPYRMEPKNIPLAPVLGRTRYINVSIFLRTRLPHPAIIRALNKLPCPRSGTPRSGYRGSDLVLWH